MTYYIYLNFILSEYDISHNIQRNRVNKYIYPLNYHKEVLSLPVMIPCTFKIISGNL